MTSQAPIALDNSAPDPRAVTLVVALCLGVATQAIITLAFGSTPYLIRNPWSIALTLLLLLAAPGAGLIWATWRARNLPIGWRMGLLIAAAGVLMRAPYFGAGPMLEDDHFRYLLDGAMLAQGLSPYTFAPQTVLNGAEGVPPQLVEAGHAAIAAINFPELRTIYPGSAQLVFALAHVIAPWSIDGLRLVIFVAEALAALLIWRLLTMSGRSPLLVALYWCNPLMAFCLTGQAHIDGVLALPVLAALLAAHRRVGSLAGLGLGLAVGVKLWPILLAPLIARRLWPDRQALAAFALVLAVATIVLCGPLFLASLSANAGLTAYAGRWSVNNAPYAWLTYIFVLVAGAGTGELLLRSLIFLIAAGASLAIAFRKVDGLEMMIGRAAVLGAVLFYLSPAQFPWYSAWFIPLAAASGKWILVAPAIGLPIYYLFFPFAEVGLLEVHGYSLAALHLAPVLVMAFLVRKASGPGAPA